MAEPIGSTPVSLERDIILIREARFGRDVREAIADALTRTKGFVDDVKTEYTTIQGLYEGISEDVTSLKGLYDGVTEDVTKLKGYAHDGYSGFVPMTTTSLIGLEEKIEPLHAHPFAARDAVGKAEIAEGNLHAVHGPVIKKCKEHQRRQNHDVQRLVLHDI